MRGLRIEIAALMLFLALGIAIPMQAAFSATPHSTPKTCGYEGGPSCPTQAPIITAWRYIPLSSFIDENAPNGFGSEQGLISWFQTYYAPPSFCSDAAQSPVLESSPPAAYTDGVESRYYKSVTLNIVYSPNLNPPCASTEYSTEAYAVGRNVSCPLPYSVHYQSGPPVVGPWCPTLPATQPSPVKFGCPSCSAASNGTNSGGANAGSGATVKGNQVDVSNANVYLAETDYAGAGTDPIKFVRSYNSQSYLYNTSRQPPLVPLGVNWWATYFQFLSPATVTDSTGTYNTVYAYRPDGRILIFTQYNGTYSPDADVADSLLQTSNGWQYQTADDTIETYNSVGLLLSVAPRGKAPVTVNYAAGSTVGDGPTSVSDAFGHSLQFTYTTVSGNLVLTSITDPNGKTISLGYNSSNTLTSVTNADSTKRTYGYYYEFLTTLTDEAQAAYLSWTYNSSGSQVLSSQNAGGVNAYTFSYSGQGGSAETVTVTDPLSQSRTYNQSLIWNTYRVTSASSLCPGCSEDASRVYDANGNITQRKDFNGNQANYIYTAQTNLETSRTEAYGTAQARTIATQWDPSWSQPDLITEPSRTTGFTYDAMGNVLTKTVTDTTVTPNVARTWTFTYDSYGRMLTAKGPRTDVNSTTTYAYYTCTTGYQCGQLQTVTDPVGNITTYNTYNAHGQPLTITDPNGVVTTLTYDLRERLTSRQVGTETTSFGYYPTGLLEQVTLPDSSLILYTYDPAHRLTEISDGAGNSIQYTLDAMGNRTATKTYDPSSVLHGTHTRVYNALNELYEDVNAANTAAVTTTYGYDSNGNQTTIAAPVSRNTTNAYDPLNRLSQTTDPGTGNTYFSYDTENNLTSVKDPRSLTTTYGYNGFGDVKSLASPDTGSSSDTYDSGGNLSVATDARGATSNYSYDAANRVTQIVYKNSGGVSDQTIAFGYDAGTNGKGRLTSASDANHSMSWSYDTHGRVTGKGLVVGTFNKSIGYAYTNADQTAIVTPSGQSVTYGYNSNHQVTSVAVNGTTVISAVTYEPFGGVDGWTWGNSTTVSRSFNGDGLVSQIVTAGTTLGYSFDNANRITGISDSSNSALTWGYGYDALDRLTSATTSAITDGWTYDANGNRLTQTGTTAITFTVSPTSNQVTATSGGLVRSYAYDAAGNTTSDGTSFTYNDRGRMASTSGSSTLYLYNALGQMIEKSGTPGTTVFMQDEAGHLVGEYSSSGTLVDETVWLGDIPVATLQPNGSGGVNIFYVHSDHLNAPRAIPWCGAGIPTPLGRQRQTKTRLVSEPSCTTGDSPGRCT